MINFRPQPESEHWDVTWNKTSRVLYPLSSVVGLVPGSCLGSSVHFVGLQGPYGPAEYGFMWIWVEIILGCDRSRPGEKALNNSAVGCT